MKTKLESPFTEQLGVRTNGSKNGASKTGQMVPKENLDMVLQKMEQMEHKMNHQMKQMDLQVQSQVHDLRSGNHDMVVGVQALGGAAQVMEKIVPFASHMFSELPELMIDMNADEGYFEFELEVESNGG